MNKYVYTNQAYDLVIKNNDEMSPTAKAMIIGDSYEKIRYELEETVENLNMDLVDDGLSREDKMFVVARIAMGLPNNDIKGQLNYFRTLRGKEKVDYFDIETYRIQYRNNIESCMLAVHSKLLKLNPIFNPVIRLLITGKTLENHIQIVSELQPILVEKLNNAIEANDMFTAESINSIYKQLIDATSKLDIQVERIKESYRPEQNDIRTNKQETDFEILAKKNDISINQLERLIVKHKIERIESQLTETQTQTLNELDYKVEDEKE